ncbi:UDP-GlcNAc:betaGal beta-1,3-N-acetylglucosaminyltransferase 9 [Megalops cyprinoides]|uniref:UDP-GlcNAc:betaGal beta-1,3-N-acetylglucosaminyltransferase 9 n=1 Tax=Megalops cyprinoides TaxID=118141 RepID=UPI0018642EE0|nr:UDP-GlcNAc:betaGal beta-1,3-N-acetylglucosaminyltransferase 9 [Megalops cyprinoides]
MRRIHLKGDLLCTLVLLVLLGLLLYVHHALTPSWGVWRLEERATSSRALLGAVTESQETKPAPSQPTERPRSQALFQFHFQSDSQARSPRKPPRKAQTKSQTKLQTKPQPRPQSKTQPKPPAKPQSKAQSKPQSKAQAKAEGQAQQKGKAKEGAGKAQPALPTRPPFDFEQYLLNKDSRNFQLLIDQPGKCAGDPPYLLIAIKSVAADFHKRQVVRRTWGREGMLQDGVQVETVFLLGVPHNRSALPMWDRLLTYESHTFKDILLWDFEDTFFNLTLKETHFLKWVNSSCPNVRFIFKGDADVYVNVDNILEMLRDRDADGDLFVGDIIFNARPIRRRSSKYFVPEIVYGQGIYPAYAGGGGFVMSGHTARRLNRACEEVEIFPIDDVFLGMCLMRIGLEPSRHEGFRTFGIVRPSAAPHLQVFDPCFYRELMVVHSLTVPQIWLMWNLLHDPQLQCHTRISPTASPFRWRDRMVTTARPPQTTPEPPAEPDYGVEVFVRH